VPRPQTPDLLRQGLSALQRGDLAEAREDLEQASESDPRNPYVWSSLAETYLRLQDRDKALSAAGKAEKLGGDNPVLVHALGMFYLNAGDLDTGLKFAKRAADAHLSFEYANALLHQEDFTRAADVITAALAQHPKDAQLTLALGVTRYGQRRFDDAIDLFLRTIELQPDALQPYVFLGKMLDQAGARLPKITTDFERWAAANPDSGVAQLLLAKALLASDEHSPRAADLLQRAVNLEPDNWEAHYQYGAVLESKHDYQAAATQLSTATQLAPNEAMPHYHLARVYDRLGESEKAREQREIHSRLTNTHNPETKP